MFPFDFCFLIFLNDMQTYAFKCSQSHALHLATSSKVCFDLVPSIVKPWELSVGEIELGSIIRSAHKTSKITQAPFLCQWTGFGRSKQNIGEYQRLLKRSAFEFLLSKGRKPSFNLLTSLWSRIIPNNLSLFLP